MIEQLPDAYLLRFGEMAIKGRNRDRYVDDLVKVIKPRVAPLGGRIEKKHKKLLLRCDAPPAEVRKALQTVFGLVSVSPIWRLPVDLASVEAKAWELLAPFKGGDRRFAVRVKRVDKRFSLNSKQVAQNLAQALFDRGLNLSVDLKTPDLPLGIVIEPGEIWLFLESWPGLAGLPVCEHTRFGLLLSGGIDSPVAGNMIQKRGGHLEVIYFDTPPYTTDGAREKVLDHCELLARFQNRLTLHTVNITAAMQSIRALADPAYTVILSRRLMIRLAEKILNCQALVTGESLSQVASQSIENLAAVDQVARLPVLRPLIGLDKQEIINRAERLGSFEISKRADQDCCSLFAPDHPVTRAKSADVADEERKLQLDDLLQSALLATHKTEITPDFQPLSK